MNNIQSVRQLPIISAVAFALILGGCGGKKEVRTSTVTVAVEGDVDGFNPLFAEDIVSGETNDLIYPRLVNPDFDPVRGSLGFSPYLARSWEFSGDHRDLTFHLRGNARWSDGTPVTARDVQFSFVAYGDTTVASVRQSIVHNLRLTNGQPDVARSVEPLDDTTVVFHFEKAYPGQLFDIGVPILPAHIFRNVQRKDLRTFRHALLPVTSGPFTVAKWSPMQEVVLERSESTFNAFTPGVSRVVLKVLPDYRSRVEQLKSGEVDIVAGLRIEEADLPKHNPALEIVSTVGRDYDFIGWNNIDSKTFSETDGRVVRPHPLFGSSRVRRALTMAINRPEIVRAYLGMHGQEAFGGVSPLFKWAFNDTLQPLPYDRAEASQLLEQEGWRDSDGDGILDRNGLKFSFTLKLASGNQLRDLIATVIQQQLKAVRISMQIEQVERGTFWNDLMARKYDAWFAGFSVPLQMQLDDLWGSDLKAHPFNLAGFQNRRVDAILAEAKTLAEEKDGADLWKEFQVIVQQEQPYTFLFWINNIVGINKRVKGTHVGILGTTYKAWEWYVAGDGSQ